MGAQKDRGLYQHPWRLAEKSDYFAALARVETYQLSADRLTFYSDQGESILLFRPAAD